MIQPHFELEPVRNFVFSHKASCESDVRHYLILAKITSSYAPRWRDENLTLAAEAMVAAYLNEGGV